MVEQLVQVIDRIIALLDRRRLARRQMFEDFIEPIFIDLALVHGDYRSAFREFAHALHEHPGRQAVEGFEARRLQLEVVRTKLQALTKALGNKVAVGHAKLPDAVLEFLRTVEQYFISGSGHIDTLHPQRGSTWWTTLLDLVYVASIGSLSIEHCRETAYRLLEEIDGKWSDVTAAYAQARLACLLP